MSSSKTEKFKQSQKTCLHEMIRFYSNLIKKGKVEPNGGKFGESAYRRLRELQDDLLLPKDQRKFNFD